MYWHVNRCSNLTTWIETMPVLWRRRKTMAPTRTRCWRMTPCSMIAAFQVEFPTLHHARKTCYTLVPWQIWTSQTPSRYLLRNSEAAVCAGLMRRPYKRSAARLAPHHPRYHPAQHACWILRQQRTRSHFPAARQWPTFAALTCAPPAARSGISGAPHSLHACPAACKQ